MATTTNYSWTTPDDTALVKDGAAAIRTLGSSIDTTTKALNPSTTLGDIEYRSSTANTNTKLGIGTTGQVLTVASGVPSWATPTATTPTFVGCMLFFDATQSIANNTVSSIIFDQTDYIDTDAFHNPATNNTRITIPSGKGGKYLVYGGIYHDTCVATTNIFIALNGTNWSVFRHIANGRDSIQTTQIMNLVAGDYVELKFSQQSGGNVDIWGNGSTGLNATRFGVQYLGA